MDVASAAQSGTVAWHENDGGGKFTDHILSNAHPEAHSVYTADMDGDGHADLVLASIEEGVVVYKGDGALRFTLAGQIASAPNPRIALGDANGDGLVDLCMLHGATKSIPDGGGVQVFLNSDDVWTER